MNLEQDCCSQDQRFQLGSEDDLTPIKPENGNSSNSFQTPFSQTETLPNTQIKHAQADQDIYGSCSAFEVSVDDGNHQNFNDTFDIDSNNESYRPQSNIIENDTIIQTLHTEDFDKLENQLTQQYYYKHEQPRISQLFQHTSNQQAYHRHTSNQPFTSGKNYANYAFQQSMLGKRTAPVKIENYANTLLETVDRHKQTKNHGQPSNSFMTTKKRQNKIDRKRTTAAQSQSNISSSLDSNKQCPEISLQPEDTFTIKKANDLGKRRTRVNQHQGLTQQEVELTPLKAPQTFPCTHPGCEKQYSRKHTLFTHILQKHSKQAPKHKCNFNTSCDKSYFDASALQQHLNWHLGVKAHKCELCPKTFTTKGHKKEHFDSFHRDIRQHECNVCHLKFHRNSILKIHMRRHTNEKPYVCQECNKGFTESGNLNTHKKNHARIKDFKCPIVECGMAFITKSQLKQHLKSVKHLYDIQEFTNEQLTQFSLTQEDISQKISKLETKQYISSTQTVPLSSSTQPHSFEPKTKICILTSKLQEQLLSKQQPCFAPSAPIKQLKRESSKSIKNKAILSDLDDLSRRCQIASYPTDEQLGHQ